MLVMYDVQVISARATITSTTNSISLFLVAAEASQPQQHPHSRPTPNVRNIQPPPLNPRPRTNDY